MVIRCAVEVGGLFRYLAYPRFKAELVINYLIAMEEDFKGIADERVKRFLAFIKKHEKD